MATFNLVVRGTVVLPLLGVPQETHSSCQSVFDMTMNSAANDNITLNFTAMPGTFSYTCQLDTGSGFQTINNLTHNFTLTTGAASLRVIMENSGSVEQLEVEVEAVNNTTPNTVSRTLLRDSTGAIC